MQLYRFRLRVQDGFITDWAASALFGLLCWHYRDKYGENQLVGMLDAFEHREPPFVVSDGFPGGLLPRPAFPVAALEGGHRAYGDVVELRQALRSAKKFRQLTWLTLRDFARLQQGERPEHLSGDNAEEGFIERERTHTMISRSTGTTTSSAGGNLFAHRTRYAPDGTVSLYVRAQPDWVPVLQELLGDIGRLGIGKRRSVGNGVFSLDSVEKMGELDAVEAPNAMVTFARVIPHPEDPTHGFYDTEVYRGRVAGHQQVFDTPFKQALLMLRRGAVFYSENAKQGYMGRTVAGVAPGHPEVLHYGYALTVPLRLPAVQE